MDGILNINKPGGKTSFDIVALVKRRSGERHVGHAGTLDPGATGVLPVCLGQGTRVVEFLMEGTKCYQAQIELGVATDTYDASGKTTHQEDPSRITREELKSALASFSGTITQVPPLYSAVKHQGKPLYYWARSGVKVEPRRRPATIHRLELVDFTSPVVTLEIECGKGTYIRSIAQDLGQVLGCGACLKSLIRQRYGPFDINDAVSLPQLTTAFHYGYWPRLVYPIDMVLYHWAAMILSLETAQVIRQGRPLAAGAGALPSPGEERCRAYTADGGFLGVLHFNSQSGQWQPRKILGSRLD